MEMRHAGNATPNLPVLGSDRASGDLEGSSREAPVSCELEPAKVRIQALDAIRGVAVMGILAVNADGFAAPQSASLKPLLWLYPNTSWTAYSYWIMDTFFHEKFLAIFSMLFGISLYLVGGEVANKKKSLILARRLAVLFLFGMLHGFGIWWGDILSLYAVTGIIMFFFRSLKSATLMRGGVFLYIAIVVSALPLSRAQYVFNSHVAGNSASIVRQKLKISNALIEAKSSWGGAYHQNTLEYRKLLSGDPWLIPQTLALMMIGLSLFKSGFFAGRSNRTKYLVVLIVGSTALLPVAWLTWQTDICEARIPGEHGLILLLSPLVSLAYVSVIILLLQSGVRRFMSPVAAAGRMAFTNYISQSIVMTSIFYGGRGAMMGKFDRPALWALTIGIWISQLIWSSLWLSRFEMGPLEWLWRCLTVGHRVPIRKHITKSYSVRENQRRD